MRTQSRALKNIRRIYDRLHLDEDVYHKAKLVLTIYRDVVWASNQKVDELLLTAGETCGQDLGMALTYLSDFAPTEQKQDFEYRVACLFETKWLIDLIEAALVKVHGYHTDGQLYFEILSKSYTTVLPYTETELLEAIKLERSTFYDKKKEALMLFGISLWGYAIPQLKNMYDGGLAAPDCFSDAPTNTR